MYFGFDYHEHKKAFGDKGNVYGYRWLMRKRRGRRGLKS